MALAKLNSMIGIVLFLPGLAVTAQVPSHGELANDIQVTASIAPPRMPPVQLMVYRLTNLYSSPLVAFTFSTKCPVDKSGTVSSDAALDYAIPWLPGEARDVAWEEPDCDCRLTSAIFGDGRRDGDQNAIDRVLLLRTYALAQLRPIADLALQEYLAETPNSHSTYDSGRIIGAIQDRQARLPEIVGENRDQVMAEQEVLRHLLEHTQALAALANESDFKEQQRKYLDMLDLWKRILLGGSYPATPVSLRRRR